jgi:hypothetical protein
MSLNVSFTFRNVFFVWHSALLVSTQRMLAAAAGSAAAGSAAAGSASADVGVGNVEAEGEVEAEAEAEVEVEAETAHTGSMSTFCLSANETGSLTLTAKFELLKVAVLALELALRIGLACKLL